MLTPVDVQNKVFKGGIGFDKKDVEYFIKEVAADYEKLYRSNVELKDKVSTLNESLQHYRSIEDSMQKAMTLSEKTAEETVNAANEKGRQLIIEAEKKAESILEDARNELSETKNEIHRFKQLFNKFKSQYTDMLNMQLGILNGEITDIDLGDDFMPNTPSEESSYSSSLGGGLGEGGYVGNSSFERTNQEPMFASMGPLNTDPFTAAQNGGGRFSTKHTQAYGKKSRKKSDTIDMKTSNHLNKKSTESVENTTFVKQESQPEKKPEEKKPEYPKEMEHTVEAVIHDATEHKEDTAKDADFIHEKEAAATVNIQEDSLFASNAEQKVISGEVEDKLKESSMLESDDNQAVGFDFISDDIKEDTPMGDLSSPSSMSSVEPEEDTYSGEVEDKIKESTMLESEDNLNEGFDFLVGNEENEEDIPVIFNIPDVPTPKAASEAVSEADSAWEGVVEEGYDPSSLIESSDIEEDDFKFL